MKIFVSYRFTGEEPKELKHFIESTCNALEKTGCNFFCSYFSEEFFRQQNFSHKQILEYAFKEIDTSDCILALIKSGEKSEGMLLEIGYAIAKKKKFILALKKGVKPFFLEEMAEKVIEFEGIEDLCYKLSKLKV